MHPRGISFLHNTTIPLIQILGMAVCVLFLSLWQVIIFLYGVPASWSIVLILGGVFWVFLSVWVLAFRVLYLFKEAEGLIPPVLRQATHRFWKLGSILILWQLISTSWHEYTEAFPERQVSLRLQSQLNAPVHSINFIRSSLPKAYQKALDLHLYDLLRLYKILGQSESVDLNFPEVQWQIDSLYQGLLAFKQEIDTLVQDLPDTSGVLSDSLIRQDTLHHVLLLYFLESKIRSSLEDSTQLAMLPQVLEDTLKTPGLLYPTLRQLIAYHQGLKSLQEGELLRDSLIRVMLHENFQRQVRKVARSQRQLLKTRYPQSFPKLRKWRPKED